MRELNHGSLSTVNETALTAMGGDGSPDELSVFTIMRVLTRRRALILITAVVVFGLVAFYTYSRQPIYESVARLQIDPAKSNSLGLDEMLDSKLGSGDANSRLKTEVNLIQSDAVVMRVISTLGLAKRTSFAGKAAQGATITDPLAMSPHDRERMVAGFQRALKVKIVPDTQIVEIRLRSTDKKLATEMVNALVDQYMQRNFQTHYQGTVEVSNWLSGQLQELQNKTAGSEQKLAEFQKQYNMLPTGGDETDNIVVDRLKMLNSQFSEAEADRIVKEARYRLAATGNPELIASVAPSTTLPILRSQEADLKQQLAQLRSKFGAGYPKTRELQAQLSSLDISIQNEISIVGKRLEEEYLSAAKTESLSRNEFEAQKEKAYQLNEHSIQYAVLKHDIENGREIYDALQLKLKMAGVTAGLSSSYIDIVDRALVPDGPVSPNIPLNLTIGLFGGVITGLLLAFGVESLDDTLSTSEEVEAVMALPVLSSIPVNQIAKPAPGGLPLPIAPWTVTQPHSQGAEAFRALRTSLLLSSPDRQSKVIMVVSALPAEGKTTVSANLAVSFAQHGESVLLIDADFRRSSIHTHFGVEQTSYGMTNVITQGMNDRAILTPIEALPNLKLLPCGPQPPNPAELLGSKRMAEALEAFRAQYDRVILDCPPVLPVADSLALAGLADAIVMVVRSGVSRKKAILRVRELLYRANGNLIGLVLNYVDLKIEHYYYASGALYGKSLAKYYGANKEDDS